MKLTYEKAIELQVALKALDGYNKVIKSGENETQVQVSYKFSGGVRIKISRNLAMLNPEIQAFNKARAEKFREISGGMDRLDPNDAEQSKKIVEIQRSAEEMLADEVDIDLKPIKEAELQLDDNPIPGSIVAGMLPILVE